MGKQARRLIWLLLAALATALCLSQAGMASATEGSTGPESCEEAQRQGSPLPPGCQHLTSTALISSPNPVTTGRAVTYTAAVTPTPDGGTVGFSDLGVPIPGCEAVPLSGSSGEAPCTTTYTSGGVHTVQATYSGDASFRASESEYLSQVVNAPVLIPPSTQTSIVVSSSKNPSKSKSTVTYTATISPAPPSGVVEFTSAGVAIPLCQTVAIAKLSAQSATATCSVKYTAPGGHQIRATYLGEGSFLSAESAIFEQAVDGNSNALLAKLLGPPTSHGEEVSARFSCISAAGTCEITATLETSATRSAHKASRAHNARKTSQRASELVGSHSVSIASAKSGLVKIKLNATGRALLARSGKLTVVLTAYALSAGARTKVADTKVRLRS